MIENGNFLCLSCPSAFLAHQEGVFIPRDWPPAKGPSVLYLLRVLAVTSSFLGCRLNDSSEFRKQTRIKCTIIHGDSNLVALS